MLNVSLKNPAVAMVLSFLIIIILGTFFLKMPFAYTNELSWLDALFTSTSATCVTGLIVKDTPNDFTVVGQIIILILIQLGGMGIMTFSMAFAVILGKKLNFSSKTLINKMIDYDRPGYTGIILKKVLSLMIIVQLIGAILLIIAFNFNGINENIIFHSIFQSVSAFCNAGFSTFSDSLMGFQSSIFLNFVISILIIMGGLGFFIIIELTKCFKKKLSKNDKAKRLSVQAKIVIFSTVFLIIVGTVLIFLMEYNNVLYEKNHKTKVLASLFQSITTRTAGFNTIDISGLGRGTLLVLVIFMFIGGGSGGTAGGIKITTMFIFIKNVISVIKNEDEVFVFKRKIPLNIVNKATGIFYISVSVNFLAIIVLSITESFELSAIIFETVSAFGTVGLSTGITPYLSEFGKFVIILLMFVGRLGPLTLAIALSGKPAKKYFSYPEEKVTIG
ncbi:MAG: TrkH family potassium uptake protein [Candidatus Muiribacteriota bacterium]